MPMARGTSAMVLRLYGLSTFLKVSCLGAHTSADLSWAAVQEGDGLGFGV